MTQHLHAGARARGQRLAEARAHRVGADPVHLEQDLALGARDGVEHRGEGLDAVAQQAHASPRPPTNQGEAPSGVAVADAELDGRRVVTDFELGSVEVVNGRAEARGGPGGRRR